MNGAFILIQHRILSALWPNMRLIIFGLAFIIVFIFAPKLPLQAQNQHPALWIEHGWEQKMPHGLRLSFTPELRFQPADAEQYRSLWMGGHFWWVERLQADLALQKKWKGWARLPQLSFSLLGAGRTIFRNPQQGLGPRLRWYSDARVQWETKKWELGYRLRYQQQFNDFSSASVTSAVSYFRQKLSLQYRLSKRWQVGISEDVWFPVGGSVGLSEMYPDHRRSSISLGYSRKRVSWDVSITHDRALWDENRDPQLWILQIGRSWKLPDRKNATQSSD
ncbi:MAG: hypothetical protein ACKOA7_03220 [Bacteroidota bacterium]